MQNKGKRYRVDETKSKENKINRAIIVIILSIIAVGIVSIVLFFVLFGTNATGAKDKNSAEPMTMGIILMTEPDETYPVYSALLVEDDLTEQPMSQPTVLPTEKPEEKTWMVDIDNPDYDYEPQAIQLTDEDRELIAYVVMREFGAGGYTACCLQAQAFRDAMVYSNASAEYIYHSFQYDAYALDQIPNQNCYDAVDYIFAGNVAVPHRILVMYAPRYCSSSWHESQNFVVEYDGVRFFDMR